MNLFLNLSKINKYLFIILTLNLITRFIVIFIYGDRSFSSVDANEWGVIYDNLKNFGTMSWFEHEGFKYPTFFMPPLYVFYIYLLSILDTGFDIFIILLSQSLMAILSSYIFFKVCRIFLNQNFSLIALTIFSFYPIFLFASSQISSINLVIFLNLLFIYSVLNFKSFYFIGIVAGLGLLVRGEFILLYLLSLIYLFILKKYDLKKIIYTLIISLLIISPYLYRNYVVFNKIVITNSTGYVLWRGNNSISTVDSIYADRVIQEMELNNKKKNNNEFLINDEFKKIYKKLNEVKFNKKYEVYRDKIFFEQAKENIFNDPGRYINLYFKKFFSYLFFNLNSIYPNYYNPLSIIPEIIVSIIGFIGILKNLKFFKKYNYLYLYFFYNVGIYSFFLILPRYKLIILPILIIFMMSVFEYIINIFYQKKIFLRNKK